MIFSSILFLFLFLPAVLLVYYLAPKKVRNFVLLAASIFFYAWGEPVYVVLMIFSSIFNYTIGLDLEQSRGKPLGQKVTLIFAVVVNLFVLGFFKYYGFLVESVNSIFHLQFTYKELGLPIGISFYTFQTLSYIIDVYWGRVQAQRNIVKFSLYVTMFPQLIAGPIVRYVDIEKYLNKRSVSVPGFGLGIEYFIKGLGKKVLIANNMGAIFTGIQALPQTEMTVVLSWLGMIAYTFQIYFDFSGYSDMAIGLGKMFGFQFMKNFDYPYISKSVTEFWHRWHISLSTWFKEYVYIPLGGNRVGWARHICNILIVWTLTGLWHGADWTFIAWGFYYGIWLIAEKYFLGKYILRCPGWIRNLYTMLIVVIGWVFFSSNRIGDAGASLKNMFGFAEAGFIDKTSLYYLKTSAVLLIAAVLCSRPLIYRIFKGLVRQRTGIAIAINIIIFILSIAYLVYDTYNPFLYFRF